MIYNILLCFSIFLATMHIVVKDLAFSSTLKDPPRRINSIHEGVANKSHCPLEGQVEEKDYDTDVIKVMSQHTQYRSQHEKNKQEIKSEQGRHWQGRAKQCSSE